MEIFLGIIGIIACLAAMFFVGMVWFLLQLGGVFGGNKSTGEVVLSWILPFVELGLLYLSHRILVFLYH
ncbi:hypothetical protein D3C87_278870 [compost metagenome]